MITTTSSRPLLPVCAPRGRPVSRRSFFISNSTGDDLSSFRAGLSQHLEQSIKTRTFAASDASAAGADLIEVRLTREMPLDNIQSTPPPAAPGAVLAVLAVLAHARLGDFYHRSLWRSMTLPWPISVLVARCW